jgi:hypothetical protein
MEEVGDFEHSLELLEEVGFPEELILNAGTERLRGFLKKKKGIEI